VVEKKRSKYTTPLQTLGVRGEVAGSKETLVLMAIGKRQGGTTTGQ